MSPGRAGTAPAASSASARPTRPCSPTTSTRPTRADGPRTGSGGSTGSRPSRASIRRARPERVVAEPGFERWEGRGALGYLTLAAIVDAQLADPPERARVVVAHECFPTGALGLLGAPPGRGRALRVAHRDVAGAACRIRRAGRRSPGTNPLAIGVPSSDGAPLVADVSMGKVTHGDVLAGTCVAGGSRPVRRRAGAQGVRARRRAPDVRGRARRPGRTARVLVVARPDADPVPALRALRRRATQASGRPAGSACAARRGRPGRCGRGRVTRSSRFSVPVQARKASPRSAGRSRGAARRSRSSARSSSSTSSHSSSGVSPK